VPLRCSVCWPDTVRQPVTAKKPTIRVLLVDDHALVRAGLRLLLNQEADIEVVGDIDTQQVMSDEGLAKNPTLVVTTPRGTRFGNCNTWRKDPSTALGCERLLNWRAHSCRASCSRRAMSFARKCCLKHVQAASRHSSLSS
jgi:DNA-binding NarL/FixJ family response regulator